MTTRADENKKLIADLFQDFRTGKAFGIAQPKRCRYCLTPMTDSRFELCGPCDRELRGPFSHGGESDE